MNAAVLVLVPVPVWDTVEFRKGTTFEFQMAPVPWPPHEPAFVAPDQGTGIDASLVVSIATLVAEPVPVTV